MANESSNTSKRNEPPSQQQKHSLVEGSIKASLIRMTLPMIVGMFMMFTFSLVDTFFVSLLGTAELTAISFTFPVTFTIMSLAIGLGIGASAVVAKYIGREDLVRAKESSTVINYVALAFAGLLIAGCWFFMEPLFTVMGADAMLIALIHDYMSIWFPGSVLLVGLMTANSILRAHGDSKTPSIIMAGSGLINALLDPLLIFGWGPVPAMGVKGAAIATLAAWTVGYGYLFYHLAIKHQLISTSLPSQQILISSSREMLRIGLPAAGANMMTPLAMGTMTAIAAGFGTSVVAAFGVGARLEPIATLLVLAMSSTLPPLISQNYGAGRLDRIKEAYSMSLRFIVIWQFAVYLLLILAAPWIAGLFTSDPEVLETIRLFIWILPMGYGMQGIIILSNSSLNAMHRPMTALYLSIARFFVFYVPCAYLGSRLYGVTGFFGGAVFANTLVAMISWVTVRRALAAEKISHAVKQ
ncbi:MAG: MATE family efflux transporter [Pseudohongiellaceae bacterium]